MAAMVIYLLLRRSTTVWGVHKIIWSASRLAHTLGDHSRPAGLENLHLKSGSLIRDTEPNKEERWEQWRRTWERCQDWNFVTLMLLIIYLIEVIGVETFLRVINFFSAMWYYWEATIIVMRGKFQTFKRKAWNQFLIQLLHRFLKIACVNRYSFHWPSTSTFDRVHEHPLYNNY